MTTIPCSYPVPVPVPPGAQTVNPMEINLITIDRTEHAELILQNPDANCVEGWQLVDSTSIRICSGTCARVNAEQLNLVIAAGCTFPAIPH